MNLKVEEGNIRIDQYLSSKLDISRSKVQKLIKEGQVLLNGKVVNSSSIVHANDFLEVDDKLDFDINIEAENIPLDIIYEDDYLLVINKKSGMVVHPAPGHYSNTLVNALLGKFSLSNAGDKIRPGIVHRLDKDTSGLMLVAKDDKTHEMLSLMLKNKQVERKYIALVSGVIKHDSGTIDAPIGRDVNNRQKMMVTDLNAKEAVTHFRVVERFDNYTLIECKLDTGRTHQIRVHMSYIGYPIVNDPVYGKSKKTSQFGQLLHSYSIKFIHPITQKEIFYEVKLPDEFEKMLKELKTMDK